jgi:hypothetical protein
VRPALRATGAAAAAATLAAAGIAGAAPHPKSGYYAELKGTPLSAVVGFSLKGTKLYDITHYDAGCVRDQIQSPIVTHLKGATFAFDKTVNAEGGKGKYALRITGRFTSGTQATGTATYRKTKGDPLGPAGCHSTVHFTVKRIGPPRPPNLGS